MWIMSGLLLIGMMPLVSADVYINVMALNGSPMRKETTVKYNLPGELKSEDVVDTNGLELDYNVNDANYYVHGVVVLEPKESKTFKIQVKDVWKVTPAQVDDLKKQIDEGYARLGKVHDAEKADVLKDQLVKKLDYILDQQNTKAESVEKRIDSYRTYANEIKRIQTDALGVDYWRSTPGEETTKIIRYVIEVENPATNPAKLAKHKHYLPTEVKPEHVVEAKGFEIRFDEIKQQAFLLKEEQMASGEKKKYSIGIKDVWTIPQKDIDYLRVRGQYASDFLQGTKYADSAKYLLDRITTALADIEASQSQQREIKEHISTFRFNQKTYEGARKDVETLEKLLATFRENLEKSKVDNVLKKVKSLKGVADISKAIFNKPFEANTAWSYIGWVLLFVAILTAVSFGVSTVRAKDKKLKEEAAAAAAAATAEKPEPAKAQAKKT